MRNKREYISLIIISLFLGFVACSSDPKNAGKAEYETLDFTKTPSMQGEDVHTLVTDSGKLTYKMQTPKLLIYDKVDSPYWDMPEGLHMTTYSPEGEVEGDIKAKFALYYVDKDLWELRKEVIVINPDSTMVETELLYWDRIKKEIYTDEFVKITEEGAVTTGYGFKTDEKFEDWYLEEFSYN